MAETVNNCCNNIVTNLLNLANKIFHKTKVSGFNLNLLDPIEAAFSKYKNHPSLNAIKGNMSKLDNSNCHLEYRSLDKKLEKVNPKKASQVNNKPVKVIK